ncbi:hypothetical protein ACW7G2_00730 [Luteimonas sp. A277]
MATPYALRTREPSISADADQIEYSAIRGVSSVFDDAAFDEIVSGELDDHAEIVASSYGDRAAWHQRDLVQEELVGGAAEEIQRRKEIMGDFYPFRVVGNQIVYEESASYFYEFCLTITMAPTIVKKPYTALPRTFERSVSHLVAAYFGSFAKNIHVGWPRTPKSRFKEALASMQLGSHEWVWGPEPGLDEDPPYTVTKDETVDFIVTANMLDSRPGHLYVIGQCACGNDWDTKLNEPNLDQIRKWFNPAWLVPPVKAFTTPFVLGNETLRETSRRGGLLVFDRIRLSLVAEKLVKDGDLDELKDSLLKIVGLIPNSV